MAKGNLKGDLINDGYSQLRISGLTVDPTPEDLELALMRLENMAHEWFVRNICAGYYFEDEPDPNTPHNVGRGHWQAFATNLAIRLVPDFNKDANPVLFAQASSSLSTLSAQSARDKLRNVQPPNRQPLGSGNTIRWSRWLRWYRPIVEAPLDCSTQQMQVGEIDDKKVDFTTYLRQGETISSYTIEATDGLTLSNDSLTTPVVFYTVEAVGNDEEQDNVDAVQVKVTTSDGRVEIRTIMFEVSP
jgi:hypothetical protein